MEIIRHALFSVRMLLAIALGCTAAGAGATDFPNRPIKLVVPFVAGSTNDIVARAINDKLQAALGQPVIVENRAGAGGTLATGVVAASPPDGYTLLVASSGHTISPFTMQKLPYDTLRDLKGVTMLTFMPVVLVVSPNRGFDSVSDLVAYAKAKPDALSFGSAGIGSSTHMHAEKFGIESGFKAVHIPFKGTPEALREIVAGRIDYLFSPLAPALPLVRSGQLKALAVGAPERVPQLPDVPTFGEVGASEYVFWVGLVAPSKTPTEIVDRLNQEIVKIMAQPEIRARFDTFQGARKTMSPSEMDEYIRAELLANEKVVKAAKISPQ